MSSSAYGVLEKLLEGSFAERLPDYVSIWRSFLETSSRLQALHVNTMPSYDPNLDVDWHMTMSLR